MTETGPGEAIRAVRERHRRTRTLQSRQVCLVLLIVTIVTPREGSAVRSQIGLKFRETF